MYVQTDEHIEAHLLICFMALPVLRILKKIPGFEYTTGEVLETLREMWMFRFKDDGYMPDFERTELTDRLCDMFDLPIQYEFISKSRFEQIRKKSREAMRNRKSPYRFV